MTDVARVALTARLFTVAALTSLAVVAGQQYLPGALLVLLVAASASAVSAWTGLSQFLVAALEGSAVAVAVVAIFPDQANVVPYLAVPVLIGGLAAGRRGTLVVTLVEFGVLALLWSILRGTWTAEVAATALTWLATSVGLGALGALLRGAVTSSATETSYRTALGLIRRLDALSGQLSGGLDAVGIAEQVMEEAERAAPTRHAGVLVPSSSGLVPLRYTPGSTPAAMSWGPSLAGTCAASGAPVLDGEQAAVPVLVDDEVVAVLVLAGMRTLEADTVGELARRIRPLALQLQAALLFGRVREAATSEERQRIAREVHDGVAQDVASLGYLVDNLHEATDDPEQQARILQVRQELSRVVAELRHSIFDLRQAIPADSGLGDSLSAYARHVGSTSPMTVHVTLDEEGPRLHADVEHELLRIAQEAMNNARKHSGAQNLWLSYSVRAPYAELEVRDDGTRPHSPAPDSQGLKIMRERAGSIGASLEVSPPSFDAVGTRVSVKLGAVSR